MTPKEKAKELIDTFQEFSKEPLSGKENAFSKKCALTCVDEIINTVKKVASISVYMDEMEYWRKVKKEITNL